MRAADDADDERAFAIVQLARGFSEIRARRLLDAIGTGAEVDAVQITGEDLVLGVARFEAQRGGDFEKLPVQALALHLETIPRELHAEGGGALGEIPVLEVSNGGAGEAADVHPVVFEEPCVLTGAEGFHQEIRDVRPGDELPSRRAGNDDFHSLAIIEGGACGQLADLVKVVAHGEQEIEERHGRQDC